MREYRYKNNNHYIVLLVFAIVGLVLAYGTFMFWQLQHVKQTFENVANRDLPLISQLSPLMDRQIEQTLVIKSLNRIDESPKNPVLGVVKDSFLRTGQRFDNTVSELIGFVKVKMPAANSANKQELATIRTLLEQVQLTHQKYQQQVVWMIDGLQGKTYDYLPSSVRLVSTHEKQLASELTTLREQVEHYIHYSTDKIRYYDSLMVQVTLSFIMVVLILTGVHLFYVRQLMLSRERAVAEINHFATFDALTKLLNRRYFNERLEQAIKSATRHEQPLSLCVCDIDNFQHINEVYGEDAGDITLAGFADILAEQMRATDVAGRIGPDEFVFFFPNTTAFEAEQMLKRIRRLLNSKTFTNNNDENFSVTATFGVAELCSEYKTSAALLGAADRALYKGKEQGQDLIYAVS